MERIRLKGEDFDRIILNPSKDKCPICETPLKNVYFTWRILHGEAMSSCCGAVYQIKSYWVDKNKYPEEYEFAKSLDNPEKILFKINEEWIEPLKQAIKKTGIKNIHYPDVFELAKEIRGHGR